MLRIEELEARCLLIAGQRIFSGNLEQVLGKLANQCMKSRMESLEDYTRSEGIRGKHVTSEHAPDLKTRMIV